MDNIESIQKNIIYLGTLKISHKLTLGRLNQSKQKLSNVSASEYTSTKYSNTNKVCNLTVNTSDYLVFEHTSNNPGEKKKIESIFFSYPNMLDLRRTFRRALSWFKKDDLYLLTQEGYFLNDKYANLMAECYGASDKRLVIRPDILEIDGEAAEGVNLIINDVAVTQIELHDLQSISAFIDSFDLYNSSLLLYQTKELYLANKSRKNYSDNSDGLSSPSSYKPKTRKK